MIKRLVLVASIFMIIGVIGSVFTFKGKLVDNETIAKQVNMETIDNLEIFMSNGMVELVSTDSDQAKIEFTGDTSAYDFVEKIDDRTLNLFIKEKGIKLFNVDLFSFGQTLRIELPEKIYDSFKIDTENGKIHMNNLHVNFLESKTDNGRINFQNIVSKQIKVTTSNGRINMKNIEGEIEAHSSNGKIEIALQSLDQSLDLSTNNGAINIMTKTEPTSTVIDAYTDNGTVKVFGKRDWDIVTGSGDHLVKLRTDNGSINIEKQ